MEAPHSRPGASLPLCAGFASGPATPTSHGTYTAGRCAPSGVCSMRGEPPAEPVTAAYLRVAGESMAGQGCYFAIDHKVDRRTIGEVCLQWMNLERGRVKGERIVRVPIGIWDKGYWGRGLGKEAVRRLMQYAFDDLGADRFCAMDVKEENVRSRALWTGCGLRVARTLDSGTTLDYEIGRREYVDAVGLCSGQGAARCREHKPR